MCRKKTETAVINNEYFKYGIFKLQYATCHTQSINIDIYAVNPAHRKKLDCFRV